MEEHFQKIAEQMADIEATKPRAQMLPHAELPQRERGAPKVAEQFWRQAATRKDRAPLKRRPHMLPRSKRKSLPSALTRYFRLPARVFLLCRGGALELLSWPQSLVKAQDDPLSA